MTYRDIMVHQGPDRRAKERLELAAQLSEVFGARLIGLSDFAALRLPTGSWPAPDDSLREQMIMHHSATIAEARTRFVECAERHGVAREWRPNERGDREGVVLAAPYADLIVIGQADPDDPFGDWHLVEDIVLKSGRPILIVPHAGEFTMVGRRVMVAWNRTRESARALHDSLPILARAEDVIVLEINPPNTKDLPVGEIEAYLARFDIRVKTSRIFTGSESEAVDPSMSTVGDFGFSGHGEVRHSPAARISEGDALLAAVDDATIDLLVMGAYGHSRLREIVFGGVTRHVLQEMTTPVLMSH